MARLIKIEIIPAHYGILINMIWVIQPHHAHDLVGKRRVLWLQRGTFGIFTVYKRIKTPPFSSRLPLASVSQSPSSSAYNSDLFHRCLPLQKWPGPALRASGRPPPSLKRTSRISGARVIYSRISRIGSHTKIRSFLLQSLVRGSCSPPVSFRG